MARLNPYLGFDGNCEEAFNFYKGVFGGEFDMLQRFKDAPADSGMEIAEEDKENILHVSLPLGGGSVLMGSDTPTGMPKPVQGTNNSISVQTDSEAETDKLFNGLSAGGTVTMPLAKTFWNAYFGMCTDKYGITWMVNYDYEEEKVAQGGENAIVHFEIPADDVERAQTFYTDTFGWDITKMDLPTTGSTGGDPYYIVRTTETDENHMVQTPGAINGGMMKRKAAGQPYMNYISVTSITDMLEKVKANGGEIMLPKTEIAPTMGWIASFKDTEGNIVGLHENAEKKE